MNLGADGLYWDEMAAVNREVKYTYSEFDGFTADVNQETQRVERTKGLVPLLSEAYRVGLIKRLLLDDKVIHTNNAPAIRAMNDLPVTHMVETKTGADRASELHLTTPYAYTWGPPSMTDFRERLFLGGICFRSSDVSPYISSSFPITPTFIGGGYIIGKERIVTAVNGLFGWFQPWKGTLSQFDSTGKLTHNRLIEENDRVQVNVIPDGLSIIERTMP